VDISSMKDNGNEWNYHLFQLAGKKRLEKLGRYQSSGCFYGSNEVY